MLITYSKKKKLITLFILIIFSVSTIAFAFLQVFYSGNQEKEKKLMQHIFERPLSIEEENLYLQEDFVVVRFYFSPNCENCAEGEKILEKLYSDLGSRILLEKIDTSAYLFQADIPSIVLKGKRTVKVSKMDYDTVKESVCKLFFSPPEKC